jgi:pimeloyl-ACP methyl ester carboxylesterase
MKQQFVINGQLINLHISRIKNGRDIVFLHGWRCDGSIWQSLVGTLNKEGFSVYLFDLPGFGASVPIKKHYTVSNYAAVVEGTIEKLGLKNVILVGHSVGGRVLIKLASQQPNYIEKLVLVDSAGFTQKRRGIEAAARIVKPFFAPSFMTPLRGKIYKILGAEDYLATPELRKTFLNIISEDLTDDLPKITAKTLLIWGEKDKETPLDFGNKMPKNDKTFKNSHFRRCRSLQFFR